MKSEQIEQAEREGKWLYYRYGSLWFSPAELRAEYASGHFRWVENWTLRDPHEYVRELQQKVSVAQGELHVFRSRLAAHPVRPNLPARRTAIGNWKEEHEPRRLFTRKYFPQTLSIGMRVKTPHGVLVEIVDGQYMGTHGCRISGTGAGSAEWKAIPQTNRRMGPNVTPARRTAVRLRKKAANHDQSLRRRNESNRNLQQLHRGGKQGSRGTDRSRPRRPDEP